MTIALVPQQFADQLHDNPGTLSSALAQTLCKQRGVQFNQADGPQAMILLPDSTARSHKKDEIELQTVKCVANRTTARVS